MGGRKIIIIGGGIIGSSLGYELVKRGESVTIVEQTDLASGASGAAAGMLAADCEHFEHSELQNLARLSRDLIPALVHEVKEISGIDAGLNQQGFLTPARDNLEAEELQARIIAEATGQWWVPEQLAAAEPALAKGLSGAIYRSEEIQVMPSKLTEALAFSAQATGAVLLRQTEVTRIQVHNKRVEGVQTSRGFLPCDQVVLAGGWGTEQLLQPLGLSFPLEPVKGEIVEVQSSVPLLQATLYAKSIYIVPKPGNKLWIGATSIPGDSSQGVFADSIVRLISEAAKWIPDLRHAQFERAWAGHRPKSPDGLPYIGGFQELQGLYAAAGHYRNGILLSAITATMLANEMEGKDTPGINLDAFRPDRFQRQLEGGVLR
ncbi:glycine oxidase ThiO [Paenibacillus sp. YPG26]|uniref:glycine oxidase ThiO n=1 Tax=Paenibacillus sp. YPG26 TaxID=2878915 RepID=UPI0020412439|nr:glycine oxidase ThiO [Paenibacillus sp. YPG26]USB34914.1 glycine oxidase ThiO [Paenibacillus sp. YPG26]